MLKKTMLNLLGIAALLAAPVAVQADEHHSSDQQQTHWSHARWDSWSHQHRDLALEIQTHPERLRDHAYLMQHRELRVYIQQDPGVVQYYPTNPYPLVVEGHPSGHWHHHDDGTWGY